MHQHPYIHGVPECIHVRMYAGVHQELGDSKKMGEEARKEVERVKAELSEADKRAVSALEQVNHQFAFVLPSFRREIHVDVAGRLVRENT
jgi:hypothetical protein